MLRDTYERFEKLRQEYRGWLERFHELYSTTLYEDRRELQNVHAAMYLASGVFASELHEAWRNMWDAEHLDRCTEQAIHDVPLQTVPDGDTGQ